MIKEYLPWLTTAGAVGGAVAFFVWNFFKGAHRQAEITRKAVAVADAALAKAQNDLVDVFKQEISAWKARFETEHTELTAYRQVTHDKNNTTHAEITRLTAENAQLQSKTDLTPVLKHHSEQSEINAKVVKSLDLIISKEQTMAEALSEIVKYLKRANGKLLESLARKKPRNAI